mgnify:CR=1 FL=1
MPRPVVDVLLLAEDDATAAKVTERILAREDVADAANAVLQIMKDQKSGKRVGRDKAYKAQDRLGGAVATIGLNLTTPPIQVQTVGAVRRVE